MEEKQQPCLCQKSSAGPAVAHTWGCRCLDLPCWGGIATGRAVTSVPTGFLQLCSDSWARHVFNSVMKETGPPPASLKLERYERPS